MNNHSLKEVLDSYKNIDASLCKSEHTITWQVSFIWLAAGQKESFQSIESFLFKTVIENSPYAQSFVGQPDWIERVNLVSWCDGLKITKESPINVLSQIKEALNEALEHEPDAEFNENNFSVEGNILAAWQIEETVEERFRIGAHWAYVFETDEMYYYFEWHWES